jgi:hypothetical protein
MSISVKQHQKTSPTGKVESVRQHERKSYQPKTGKACSCKRGVQRDNCPNCEGTGQVIDFAAIRARATTPAEKPMDNFTATMIAEGVDEADEATQQRAWQHLIDTGLAWQLQGFFGRTAMSLIEQGICHAAGTTPIAKGFRLLFGKAHVRGHLRGTKTGKVSTVHDYERQKVYDVGLSTHDETLERYHIVAESPQEARAKAKLIYGVEPDDDDYDADIDASQTRKLQPGEKYHFDGQLKAKKAKTDPHAGTYVPADGVSHDD